MPYHEYNAKEKTKALIAYIDEDKRYESMVANVDMRKYITSTLLKEKLENKFLQKFKQARSKI